MTDLELDVRPILRAGGEPFGAIMAAADQLAPGQRFKLYATFKPVPLFQVLAQRGFTHQATELADGDWEVLFTPDSAAAPTPAADIDPVPGDWPDPAHYLDCTEMDPPEPMVQILAQLEAMKDGAVLFALLGREPVFLFPELKARGHLWAGAFDETGTAYRLMVRVGAGRARS
ncbi:MAG TPA: DUF2249 domain-containing protein [Devosia sp.]|nr:DUF2249 domain-containing protein [Devosia sp.]